MDDADFCCPPTWSSAVRQRGVSCPPTWSMSCPWSLGKFVAEASNRETLIDFPLAKYAQSGANLVEISYEVFGAPNFGEKVGELKGLESAGIGADFASAKGLESWKIQRASTCTGSK